MLYFVPVLHGCVCCYVWKKAEGSSPLWGGDMGLYEIPLSVSLLGFGIGTMLANFHV